MPNGRYSGYDSGNFGTYGSPYAAIGAADDPSRTAAPTYNYGYPGYNNTGGFNPFTMFKTWREDAPYMNGGMGFYPFTGPAPNMMTGYGRDVDGNPNYSGGNYLRPPMPLWAQQQQQNSGYGQQYGNNALLGMR